MCASCSCGCKPGKPEKGCKCTCKMCREARTMSVEKSDKRFDNRLATSAGLASAGGSALGFAHFENRNLKNYSPELQARTIKLNRKLRIAGGVALGTSGALAATRKRGNVEKSFLVSKALRGFDEIDSVLKAEDLRARNAGRLAMVPVVGGYAASGYAASQSKDGRKAAVGGRTFGRGALTATGAALPGLGVSLHGIHRGSGKQVLAGQALSLGGALAGSSHGARNAVRNAQKRGDLK